MRFTPISVGLLVYCTAACSATSKDGPSAPDEPGGADTGGSTGASGAAGNAIGGENAGGQSPGTSGSGGVVGTGGAGVAVGTGGAGGASAGKDGGTGGSGKSGGADGGGADGGGATHVAKNCQALAAAGVWENITPPVTVLPGAAPCAYGGAFVENPLDPTMLYVGSCNQGIWKTTDCGANWVHINTGKNGGALDSGRQWTFVIDPVDPNVLYANSGYNTWVPSGTWDGNGTSGAFKSTNGGVDWQVMWPPADADLAKVVQYNFVAQVVMDPSVHTHLLITFHATCGAPHTQACFGESTDSGSTWHLIDGQANWAGGEGQAVYFLNDSKTWLWGSQSNGLWRTSNSGSTWAAVTDKQAQGHGAGQLYRAKDGTFYLPVLNGVLRSTDGITWNIVPNSGNTMMGAIGNGTTMYASRGFPWDPSTVLYEPFWSSPEGDGLHWTQMNSPMLSNGGELQYDSDHHILYSSNLGAGFWRVVTQ